MMFHIDHDLRTVFVSIMASTAVLKSAKQSAVNHGYDFVMVSLWEEASA